MTNKKILFTGGNGFIGRQIIPLIEGAGYDVVRPRSSQVRLRLMKRSLLYSLMVSTMMPSFMLPSLVDAEMLMTIGESCTPI